MKIVKENWCQCPKCGNPKMFRIRGDTSLMNFPAYCKKCKLESVITLTEPKSRIVNS